MNHRAEGRRRGFTLVEVLASLALVGAILPAVAAGISLAMSVGELARQQTEAAQLADGKLAEVMSTGDWQGGDAKGDFGEAWPGYTWEMTVADWQDTAVGEVALTVRWTSRGKERSLVLTTLGYRGQEEG